MPGSLVRFGLLLALLSLCGCATIIRGTEQQVAINTDPPGAQVQLSNGTSCVSPCLLNCQRNQTLLLTISKEGYFTQTATLLPTLSGAGAILGGLIDYGTGAVYDLQPNPLHLTLIPDRGGRQADAKRPQEVSAAPPRAQQNPPEAPTPSAALGVGTPKAPDQATPAVAEAKTAEPGATQ